MILCHECSPNVTEDDVPVETTGKQGYEDGTEMMKRNGEGSLSRKVMILSHLGVTSQMTLRKKRTKACPSPHDNEVVTWLSFWHLALMGRLKIKRGWSLTLMSLPLTPTRPITKTNLMKTHL